PLTARSHGLRRGLLAFALTGWRSFLAYWLRSDRCEFLRNPESHHFYVAHPFRAIPIPLGFAASYNADYRVLKPLIDSLTPERYEYTPIQRKRNSDRNAQGSHCAENATRPGSR